MSLNSVPAEPNKKPTRALKKMLGGLFLTGKMYLFRFFTGWH